MTAIRRLILGKDDNGTVTNEIPWGDITQLLKSGLSTGVEITLPIPIWVFKFKYTVAPGGIVWCGHGATPLVLAGASFTKEISELNPIVRPAFDSKGDRISTLRFLSENDTFVHVVFYKKDDSENK